MLASAPDEHNVDSVGSVSLCANNSADYTLIALNRQIRKILGKHSFVVQNLGVFRATKTVSEVVAMMGHHNNSSPIGERGHRSMMGPSTLAGRQLKVGQEHRVEGVANRLPLQEVGLVEGNVHASLCRECSTAVDGNGAQVDRSYVVAASRQPDRVAALATRGIENPTGRERAYGFHNKNIRFKAVA